MDHDDHARPFVGEERAVLSPFNGRKVPKSDWRSPHGALVTMRDRTRTTVWPLRRFWRSPEGIPNTMLHMLVLVITSVTVEVTNDCLKISKSFYMEMIVILL